VCRWQAVHRQGTQQQQWRSKSLVSAPPTHLRDELREAPHHLQHPLALPPHVQLCLPCRVGHEPRPSRGRGRSRCTGVADAAACRRTAAGAGRGRRRRGRRGGGGGGGGRGQHRPGDWLVGRLQVPQLSANRADKHVRRQQRGLLLQACRPEGGRGQEGTAGRRGSVRGDVGSGERQGAARCARRVRPCSQPPLDHTQTNTRGKAVGRMRHAARIVPEALRVEAPTPPCSLTLLPTRHHAAQGAVMCRGRTVDVRCAAVACPRSAHTYGLSMRSISGGGSSSSSSSSSSTAPTHSLRYSSGERPVE
jgi:hypothetical protein